MPMSEYLCLLTTSKRRKTDIGLSSSSHVYWRCKYHIAWTLKYRFRSLRDKLGKELYRTIYILCGIKDCEVLELDVQRSCASSRHSRPEKHLSAPHGRSWPAGTGSVRCGLGQALSADKPELAVKLD